MRDAPGDVGVVTKVWKSGNAGEGQAYDIEFRTGDVVLIVDIGSIEPPVRVAGRVRRPGENGGP